MKIRRHKHIERTRSIPNHLAVVYKSDLAILEFKRKCIFCGEENNLHKENECLEALDTTCPRCHGAKELEVLVPGAVKINNEWREGSTIVARFKCAECGGSGVSNDKG